MEIEKELHDRSESKCELCAATNNLEVYEIPPVTNILTEKCILLCSTCRDQINNKNQIDLNHWRCLNDSMWSQIPAIQVMAWRMLTRLANKGWPQDLLDMLYLEDDTLTWAQAAIESKNNSEEEIKHLDGNGALLTSGDSVTLTKDLNVKGANFTAKRGTAVRNISLVRDNPEQIEGKVNGQQIVILTKFVKKSG